MIARLDTRIDEATLPFAHQTALLATIPGIGERAAQVIISEIGVDMTRFPTAAHLASWAGLCPGNNESAGRHRSGKTRCLRPCPWSVAHELVHAADMLGDVAVSPVGAAQRLRDAAVDGRLDALAELHDLSLVVMFGSASRGQPDARDLDVAVGSRARTGLDVVAVICALMDLVDSDRVDLLDLDRAGPVARQHALVPGEPLYEYRPGEFARQQMKASGQRLGTEWMRRLDLELMAGRPIGSTRGRSCSWPESRRHCWSTTGKSPTSVC